MYILPDQPQFNRWIFIPPKFRKNLKEKDLVYKIGVIFPEQDKWSGLSTNYYDLKNMLIEKYGKPIEELEKFEG